VNPALDSALVDQPTAHEAPRQRSALHDWLATTEHTSIGRRFIATALVFFVLGGVLALIMRLQLARPLAHVVGPDRYNQVFTTHGSTMMFLFAVPVMQGLGSLLRASHGGRAQFGVPPARELRVLDL
jgi:heme/copper-type cytochrome/quinol oxidase subunit 1